MKIDKIIVAMNARLRKASDTIARKMPTKK